jgi:hypothetical protein
MNNGMPPPNQPPSTARCPSQGPAAATLEELMTQDLAAWKLAKQAILRAKLRARGRWV